MINLPEEMRETIITVPDIVCSGCVNSIKKALGIIEGISEVNVDVATKKVTVSHDADISRESLVAALDRAGYAVD